MFNKTVIPTQHPQLKQHLANLYAQINVLPDVKGIIDKKFEKVDKKITDKIANTIVVSQYFDHLWKQPDLKEKHKDTVIKKLEAIQQTKKKQIQKGEQQISKVATDLDLLNAEFQMTPFEEFNYQEKVKDIKKKNKLDIDSDLFAEHAKDLDVLFALNKPVRSLPNLNSPDVIHYAGGLCEVEEADFVKNQKAEEFIKKIKEEKKAFARKMKQIEKSSETKEQEELERYKKLSQEEEEKRLKEKKDRLEAHIKELKARSDVRLKEGAKWEEDYKTHLGKKPLFKEIEEKFKKGHLIPELEERKKKLQEIRDFHKPIWRENILEHEQKVTKMLEDRNLEKKNSESNNWSYQKPNFESKHHKTIAEELSKQRRQKEEEHLEQLRKRERMMELYQEVKEKYVPTIDPQKELELKEMIEKLNKRKDGKSWTAEDKDLGIDPKKLGGEYLKLVKDMVQKMKVKETPKALKNGKLDTEGDIAQKQTLNSVKSESSALKKKDYLLDLRKDNKIQSSDNQIDMIIKSKKLNTDEKKNLLQNEVEKLEEKVKRKEMVKKHKVKKDDNVDDDDDDGDEFNKLYINTIKAKLEMLSH